MIGVVVEGTSEELVVPVILKWLGVRFREAISRAEGVDDLVARARELADWQLSKGATHVLFCVDADGPDRNAQIVRIRAALERTAPSGRREEGTFFFVPVHELEAWLLADEAALTTVVGRPVERQTELETAGAPARLDALLHEQGGYQKTFHPRLISRAASDGAWKRCHSYVDATKPLRTS